MYSNNDNKRIWGSTRLYIAMAFALVFFFSSILLAVAGYFLFRNNLFSVLNSELTAQVTQYENLYCDFELSGEEVQVSLEEVSQITAILAEELPENFVFYKCKRIEDNYTEIKFYGISKMTPVVVVTDAGGKVLEVERKSVKKARERIRGYFELTPGQLSFWAITSADNTLLSSKADNDGLPDNDLLTSGKSLILYDSRDYMLVSKKLLNGQYNFIAGKVTDDIENALHEYLVTFLVGIIPSALFAAICGWLIAGRSMRGVLRVTDAAREFGAGNHSARAEVKNEGNEVNTLITIFNNMAAQVEKLISEQNEMTENIAHDLRTPVTRIRGMVETAIMGNADKAELQEVMAKVAENCDSLSMMINTMLEISQGETGTLKFNVTRIDLVKLVEHAVNIFSIVAEERQQTISFSGENVFIEGDLNRLQRVVSNLLDNACKYSPVESDIKVELKCENDLACISISDSGPGIPEDQQEDVFKRFYRGEWSRATVGNGLGLAFVKVIVESHNGKISLKNLNPGLEVQVKFPGINNM